MVDPAIRPAWPGAQICGRALTVECPPSDNLTLHQAVVAAQPGDVLVATTGAFLRAGAWGEILTVAAQARGIAGLAIDGAVRDIDAIAKRNFPIFSRGIAIGACTKQRPGRIGVPLVFGGVPVRPGDLVFGNVDGIVIIEQERVDEVLDAAALRLEKEAEIMDQLRAGRTTVELLGLAAAATVGGK
jgi:4-hydroxy-4-methyl-2-oxoglutarate aldolase